MTESRVMFTSDALLAELARLGIPTTTVSHPALRTVEDSKRLRGDLAGGHIKNLFLRDKRQRFWLVVALEDTLVDLKALARELGAGRFTFANEQQLGELLGIAPGAVSPLAVINDRDNAVTVVIDQAAIEKSPLNLHPLRNDLTTVIAPRDLLRFLEQCGHAPRIMALGRTAEASSAPS